MVNPGVYTLLSVLTGFASAVAIGVPLAFGIVLNRSMERVAMPFLVMSQTIPKVAIAPILVVWLSFGDPARRGNLQRNISFIVSSQLVGS